MKWIMQQATINLPSASPVRAMTGLAKTLALPAENTPARLPSFPALERTAVMGFNVPSEVPVTGGDPVKVVLARDAAFPFWSSGEPVGNKGHLVAYKLVSNDASVSSGRRGYVVDTDGSAHGAYVPSTAITYPFGVPDFNWSSTNAGTSANIPVGLDADQGNVPWVFMPDGMASWVHFGASNVSGTATTLTVDITVEVWNSNGDSVEVVYSLAIANINTNPAGAVKFSAGSAGADTGSWRRVKMVYTTPGAASTLPEPCYATLLSLPLAATYNATGGISGVFELAANTTTGALLPVVVAPEFPTSTVPYNDTRLTAVGLLLTNVTQVLNKSGTVLAGRVGPRRVPFGSVTQSTLNALHPAEKAWLPLETGLYTYCPPGSDLDEFRDYTFQLAGGVTNGLVPMYRLDNTAMVNIAYLSMPSGVNGSFAATCTTHLEFRTTSALWQIAVSGYTLETLHLAQMGMMAAGFFFENPEHKSLLTRVANGIKKLEPYATPLVAVAKAVHPPTGQVMAAAYNAARAFAAVAGKPKNNAAPKKLVIKAGPQRVPTTSAKASGILGGSKQKKKRK